MNLRPYDESPRAFASLRIKPCFDDKILNKGYRDCIDTKSRFHDFSEGCSYGFDCEASYLSKKVFAELFKVTGRHCSQPYFIDEDDILNKSGSVFVCCKSDKQLMRFDIMNNPNPENKTLRIGDMAAKNLVSLYLVDEHR